MEKDKNTLCSHLEGISEIISDKVGVCQECIKHGGSWVHLRTCQLCGVTLCCDSSPSKHASAHNRISGHPVVSSAEPSEYWLWCYEDEQQVFYSPE